MMNFHLKAPFEPCGDQPQAIKKLINGISKNFGCQTLLGVTGSGKTYTMANVIAAFNKPTLVISHNKTLAAQLASEFKMFFPKNAVEYFVSYYDYYQPEAYIPQRDLYIEKDAAINEQIERLRHSTTHSLLTRNDVIVVASVSCIYGLGSPEDYETMTIALIAGQTYGRETLLKRLISLCYERNDIEFQRGTFRVRGDIVDIFPSYEEAKAVRVQFWGDDIEELFEIDSLSGNVIQSLKKEFIYPASHYAIPQDKLEIAIASISAELKQRLEELEKENKILEAQRLKTRTNYDLEMMKEMGTCQGIENYSRHLSGRKPGEKPFVLLDYFQHQNMLIFIDESHVTVPQLKSMYIGDQSRKQSLIEYGFRLPSARDNRPLNFEEIEKYLKQSIFVSATPAQYEMIHSKQVVEQIIRPTGLLDPEPIMRKVQGQIDDLVFEIKKQIKKNERTLVVALTKKMAEDLAKYLKDLDIKAHYLHSDVDTLQRLKILKDLRKGTYDVIVGVNLLREGLDLPEVSLVAILDADKEGFLRNERSLIQTMGRAARNVNGRVILYADVITDSLKKAITETNRRRKLQMEYNKKNQITPKTIQKTIKDLVDTSDIVIEYEEREIKYQNKLEEISVKEDLADMIITLEEDMKEAAEHLEFERAAVLRDKIKLLQKIV